MPTNPDSLFVAVLALVPGYLLIRFSSRRSFRAHPDSATEWALNSLAASLVIQIVAFPVTLVTIYPIRDQISGHPRELIIWLAVVVLVVPFAGGRLVAALRQWSTRGRRKSARFLDILASWLAALLVSDIADAWDWLDDHSRGAQPADVESTEESGLDSRLWIVNVEGGLSIAGLGPEVVGVGRGRAIHLRQVWSVGDDTQPTSPVPDGAGALVPASAIKTIEFRHRPLGGSSPCPPESNKEPKPDA